MQIEFMVLKERADIIKEKLRDNCSVSEPDNLGFVTVTIEDFTGTDALLLLHAGQDMGFKAAKEVIV